MKWRFDREVWNRFTLLAVIVSCVGAFNTDLYTSSVPVWLDLRGQESLAKLAITIAIISQIGGGLVAGYFIDRYGTKKVQFVALLIMLLTALGSSFAQSGQQILGAQAIRYGACETVALAIGVQLRSLLPEPKHISGMGQLNAVSFGVAATGVWIGPWLVSEQLEVWKWIAPIVTVVGIIAVLGSESANVKPEKISLLPHEEVLKIAVPVTGIAICQGVIVTFLVLDVGMDIGSPARACMYVVSAIAGWKMVPFLINHLGEKNFIRCGVFFMMGAMLLIRWPHLIGLMVAAFIVGLVGSGTKLLLQKKAFAITEQKGRASSTEMLVFRVGMVIGAFVFGLVRDKIGMNMWLTLIPVLAICSLLLFEWSFRHSPAWREKTKEN